MSKLKKGCLASAVIGLAIVGFGWWYVWSMLHPPKLATLVPADVIEFQSIDALNMIGLEVGPLTIWEGVSQRYARAVGAKRLKSITEQFKEILGLDDDPDDDDFWERQIKSWFSREMALAVRIEQAGDGEERYQHLMLIGSRSRGKAAAAIPLIFENKSQDIYSIVKYGFMTDKVDFLDSWTDNPGLETVEHKGVKIHCPRPESELGGNVPCLASVRGALAIAYAPDTRFQAGGRPEGMVYAQEFLKTIVDVAEGGGDSLAGTELYRAYSKKLPNDYIVYRVMNFEPLAERARARHELAVEDPSATGWIEPYGARLIENVTMFRGLFFMLWFDDLSPKARLSLLLSRPAGEPYPKRFAGLEPKPHELAAMLDVPDSLMLFTATHVGRAARLFNEAMSDPEYAGEVSAARWGEFKKSVRQGFGVDLDETAAVLGDEIGFAVTGISRAQPDSASPLPLPHVVAAAQVGDPAQALRMAAAAAEALNFTVVEDGKLMRILVAPSGRTGSNEGLSPAFMVTDDMLLFATVASDLEKFDSEAAAAAPASAPVNVSMQLHMDKALESAFGWIRDKVPESEPMLEEFEPLARDAFSFFDDISARITLEDDEVAAEFGIEISRTAIKDYDWENLAAKVFDLIKETRQQ